MRFKFFIIVFALIFTSASADEKLNKVLQELKQIKKDLKTLEKAVYQKSDATLTSTHNSLKTDGLNEDILTKHLLQVH